MKAFCVVLLAAAICGCSSNKPRQEFCVGIERPLIAKEAYNVLVTSRDDTAVKARALLASLGDAGVPFLLEGIKSGDRTIKIQCLWGFKTLQHSSAPMAIPELLKLVKDEDVVIQNEALEALKHLVAQPE